MTRFLLGWFIAAALGLSGCATVDPKVIESQTAGRSIAVASAMDDNLNLMWIGTTAFNNEYGTAPVGDWKLNEILARAALTGLQATKRYSNLLAVQGVNRKAESFPKSPGLQDAEFLVLIEPESFEDRAFATNQRMKGVGLYQRTAFGSARRAVAHVGLKVELFDLRTGQSVGTQRQLTFWQVPQTLDTGPTITDAHVRELQAPILSRASTLTEELLGKLGLK